MSPITNCMKQGEFNWMKVATKAFNGVKQKMTEELVICLPNFTKPFKVECDASGFGIGGVLSHERHPIAYFSEKLNDAKHFPHITNTCCLQNLLFTLIMKPCAISLPRRN